MNLTSTPSSRFESLRRGGMFAALLAMVAVCATTVSSGWGYWSGNPALNNEVCTETASDQRLPVACTDGSDGMIVAWRDSRAGVTEIYAQKIDANGVRCWPAEGMLVNASATGMSPMGIVSDGSGGAVVVFYTGVFPSVYAYAQRIGPDGTRLWPDKVPVSSAATYGGVPVSNGAGGALVAYRTALSPRRVRVQQLLADGTLPWGADGVDVSTDANDQSYGQICSDGAGGVVAGFFQNVSLNVHNLRAQHIVAAGTRAWGNTGVAVDAVGPTFNGLAMLSDGAGGAFMVFGRASGTVDLYAQRLNSGGVAQWTANGVPICTAAENQYLGSMVPDGMGGFFTIWNDVRYAASNQYWIYMQRVNGSGVPQWTADGVAVRSTQGIILPDAVSQSWAGTAWCVLAWDDEFPLPTDPTQVYVQRMNTDGTKGWTADGVEVSTASNYRSVPRLVPSASGSVLAVWEDNRNGADYDLYASRLLPDGTLPVVMTRFSLE